MTTIPVGIRAYAEVVVTVADGIAHRPAWQEIVVGTRQVWSPVHEKMIDQPVKSLAWRPGCIPDPGPEGDLPKIYHMGAGWAHHQGYAGCLLCWPDQQEE